MCHFEDFLDSAVKLMLEYEICQNNNSDWISYLCKLLIMSKAESSNVSTNLPLKKQHHKSKQTTWYSFHIDTEWSTWSLIFIQYLCMKWSMWFLILLIEFQFVISSLDQIFDYLFIMFIAAKTVVKKLFNIEWFSFIIYIVIFFHEWQIIITVYHSQFND